MEVNTKKTDHTSPPFCECDPKLAVAVAVATATLKNGTKKRLGNVSSGSQCNQTKILFSLV
ncbi:hypothetical protein A6S26_32525 [Nostoc sp. ATCC 43529]|nr:hypothetical protein A6S26_32525 [Nostoc sp. ATCC 43529]